MELISQVKEDIKDVVDFTKELLKEKSIMDCNKWIIIFAELNIESLQYVEDKNNYIVKEGSLAKSVLDYIRNEYEFGVITLQAIEKDKTNKDNFDKNGKRLPKNHRLAIFIDSIECGNCLKSNFKTFDYEPMLKF